MKYQSLWKKATSGGEELLGYRYIKDNGETTLSWRNEPVKFGGNVDNDDLRGCSITQEVKAE